MNLDKHADQSVAPSDWVRRWSALIPAGGQVLDVACGWGRNAKWLYEQGFAVTGVDRAGDALRSLSHLGHFAEADIEEGPWPFTEDAAAGRPAWQQFDAVVVCNYLWRPLWPILLASIKPQGLLIYETFAQGNEQYGKPSRPDFLLRSGELLQVCHGMHVLGYEDVLLSNPMRCVQRIAARFVTNTATDGYR